MKKIHGSLYIKVNGPYFIIIWLTFICCGSCNKKDQVVIWVQSQSNEPKRMLDNEKNFEVVPLLCFRVQRHIL